MEGVMDKPKDEPEVTGEGMAGYMTPEQEAAWIAYRAEYPNRDGPLPAILRDVPKANDKNDEEGVAHTPMMDAPNKQATVPQLDDSILEDAMLRRLKAVDAVGGVSAWWASLTDEELDFIINYDIKYRMGRDALIPFEEQGE
jgi:hypothetical protein